MPKFGDMLPLSPFEGPPIPRGWTHHSNELTARQITIAKYKIAGYTKKEIAEILGIDIETVGSELDSAYETFGTKRLSKLFQECISRQYFTIEDLPFREENRVREE